MSSIVPAIIPQSLSHLKDSLQTVANIHEVHIDIVDGKFVTPISWPIEPLGNVSDVAALLAPHSVEVDVMTERPLQQAAQWLEIGASMVVLHVETISVTDFTTYADTAKCSIGVSALLDTPYETLKSYLAVADYTQVMGIATIGAQGQPFDKRAIDRIKQINEDFPNLSVTVDGSMNAETLPQLQALPIDRFVVGSAIMSAPVPEQAYLALGELLNHTG